MNKEKKMKFNVLAIICIIIFSFSIVPKTLQNDTYYTISTGQYIMEHGVDGQDPFAWTDLKYTYPHWLYDVGIYLTYAAGGMTGVYISTVVLTCLLGVLLYITNVRINKNQLFAFVLTIGVMLLMGPYVAARAQLLTFVLFVLEILLIEGFLDTKKKRYVVGLALDALLIANCHVAVFYMFFVFMLPYFAEYFVVKIADMHLIYKLNVMILSSKVKKLTKKNKPEDEINKAKAKLAKIKEEQITINEKQAKRRANPYRVKLVKRDAVKWLLVVAVICFAMGLLTPLGDEPYTHLIKLMSGTTTQNISEHQPLVLYDSSTVAIVLVSILALLIFTDTKITLKDLFMFAGLTILTFKSKRQFSFFLIIGVMSLTRLLCDFVNKYDKNGTEQVMEFLVKARGKVLTIILVVLCAFTMYVPKLSAKYIDDEAYPVALCDFLNNEFEEGKINKDSMRLFNDYNYGSYLLYRGIPVFIDSRADLYSPEFNEGVDIFSDYITTSNIGVYYETTFDKYEITHVMSYVNSKLNIFLSRDDNYKELYKDDQFVLYERINVNTGNYEKPEE